MNNNVLLIKLKQRLNKLASNDYDNVECWQLVELFNKGQVSWCRRNLHGDNIVKEGDEQSTSRIDDLQKLIGNPVDFTGLVNKGIYDQTLLAQWPANYLRYKRVALTATSECCDKPKRMTVYIGEESNIDLYLNDPNIKPDYAWNQVIATIAGNKLNIYHNNKFDIATCALIHYRQPIKIQIAGCRDPYTNLIPAVDVECEFNDDLVELLIDEAASIGAADTGAWDQKQRLDQDVEKNN